MKAALFFEDNQLCHLGENIGKKAIKVMIYVSGIDEKIKRFFEQMKIIVNVKEQSDKSLLLTEITSQK